MKKVIYTFSALAVFAAMAYPAAVLANDHADDKKPAAVMKMDKDGNGTISKSEYVGAAEERFAKIDADANGELTKEEMKAFREKMKAEWKARKEERKGEKSSSDDTVE